MAILAVPICLICSVRNLGKFNGDNPSHVINIFFSDHLAPFSAIANVFTAVSVAIIFSYLVPNLQNPVEEKFPKVQNFEKFALFFGTAIFSFEGISVVLPLENNAAEPEDFPKVGSSKFGQNDHWEDTSQFRNYSSFGIKVETKVSKSIDAT